jgi:protein CWC15
MDTHREGISGRNSCLEDVLVSCLSEMPIILAPTLGSVAIQDDEAELLAELERIKKERAEENARKEEERLALEQAEKTQEALRGNPILQQKLGLQPSFDIKRRWDDDVVFKNQARGEPKAQKRFINDTIRNDFHRRFLNRYIK